MLPRLASVCFLALAAGVLLAGCTDADWRNSMEFAGFNDAAPAAPAPQTAAIVTPSAPAPQAPRPVATAASLPNPFCQQVATENAQGNDFDAATQRNFVQRNYQQCVALFATVAPH